MSNSIRIKRRASGGAAGAPSGLDNAELAFNEADNILYYGWGTGGAGGTATSVIPIAGPGAFIDTTSNQTITTNWTFTNTITGSISGNAGTATTAGKWTTARNIAVTGDVSGTTSNFDGSANGTLTLTLANTAVSAGSYGSATQVGTFTVDSKGRLTAAGSVAITFPVSSVNSKTGAITLTTSDIGEGTNLYYTDARVRLNRLDQMAAPTASVSMGSQRITNLADPTAASDAATRSYVDAVLAGSGVAPFASVRAVASTNITLSGTQTIDGVALVAGNRVLLTGQSTPAQNGIYVVAAGAWSRATDASTTAQMSPGRQVFVNEGTVASDSVWAIANDTSITVGTTAISYTQIGGLSKIIDGAALSKTGNTLNVVAGTGISVAADNVALTGQALALHNLATNGFIVRTASGTVAARSLAVSGTGISASNLDGVAGNPTLSLSTALSTVGGLTPAADRIAYYTGASAAALTTLTAFGRSVIGAADAAGGRTALSLGTMSTQDAANVNITGGSITGLTTFDNVTIDGGTF